MDETDLRVDQRVRRSMRDVVREALVTGLAVVVPVIITVIVLATALQYVHGYLALVAEASTLAGNKVMVPVWGEVRIGTLLVELLTPVVLLGAIFVVGLFVSTTHAGERAVDYFDEFISRIPAIGGIYESFRKMSDVVLDSDMRNFRDVKLVEFPTDDTYTLGFVTTETPPQLAEPVGHPDMLTLFLPMAPNPVMGGHLVHVHREKVVDVDMTVEEGLRTIVTSGVAVADEGGRDGASLSEERLRDIAAGEYAERQFDPGAGDADARPDRDGSPRAAAYEDDVDAADETDPAAATTPADVARRGAGGAVDGPVAGNADPTDRAAGRDDAESEATDAPPAEAATRDPTERESTSEPPAEAATRDAADREEADREEAESEEPDREEPGSAEVDAEGSGRKGTRGDETVPDDDRAEDET